MVSAARGARAWVVAPVQARACEQWANGNFVTRAGKRHHSERSGVAISCQNV